MKEERSNIDRTCLDIEKLVEDPRSKEKEYKEGVLMRTMNHLLKFLSSIG